MSGDLIKSFLVGLGFDVDDSSLAKFNKSIETATVRVAALYGSIQATAAAIGYGITKVSEDFEKLGYEYHIIAPAINKALLLRRELLRAYSAAGINISKVVRESVNLNLSLTKTKYAFEAIYKSVASRFFALLTKQSDSFRSKLYANLPKIQDAIERFVNFVFHAFDATVQLGSRLFSILGRVYQFFVTLHKATNGWSTAILAAVAAWQFLNLEFLATPLGLIIAGLVAILGLFDDFETYKEGGKSLFNWGPAIPIIDQITAALKSLWTVLQGISDAIGEVFLAFYQLVQGDFDGVFESLTASGDKLLGILKPLWDSVTGLGGALLGIGNIVGDKLGLSRLGDNIQNAPAGVPAVSPLSPNVQNSNAQTNQHVQQQTTININGSPNASATGAAVSSEQGKVNFDLVRNLRGAIRPGGITQ